MKKKQKLKKRSMEEKLNKSGNKIGVTNKTKRTRADRKEELLKHLESSYGIVTYACKDCGVERSTFYKWCAEDEEFAAKVQEITNVKKDLVEHQLIKKIEEGDTQAILFASKCLNRDRGYNDKQEIKIESNTFEIKIS